MSHHGREAQPTPVPHLDVTVAIPTFRRNDHLRELLPLLLDQVQQLGAAGEHRARVLVIDNDPDAGAEAVVNLARSDSPARWEAVRLDYVHEPRPGLAAVRNRAVEESSTSRLLAFMDDDGRPAPAWLLHLVRAWDQYRPAAVAGRVLEEFETTPDPWIVAGRFFRRRSLTTGTEVTAAPAGNLLLDLDFVRIHDIRFNDQFGLSGGEDTLFTLQLCAAGGRIVWCDESRVVDQVPTTRLNRRWVLERSWSHGNTATLVELAMTATRLQSLTFRVRALTKGVSRIAGGTLRYVVGLLVRSDRHSARGLRAVFRGAGMISGAFGHVVQEYSRRVD